jgi:hypothetical protein
MAVPPAVPTTTTNAVGGVRHFHVSDTQVGCLPETDPWVTDDPVLALDALAYLLSDWAETTEPDEPNARWAEAVAEIYCACSVSGRSAEHADALAHLERGDDLCEAAGLRVFKIEVCAERDCLKYCSADDCRTVAAATDTDTWCSVCGTNYVPWDRCPWLG